MNTNTDSRPKRMSMSHMLELVLNRSGVERSHVSISRTASGAIALEVRVRTGDDTEIQTVIDAERRAAEVFDRLDSKYARSQPAEDGEVSVTRNAKGETQVTVQSKTTAKLSSLDAIVASVVSGYDKVRRRYPMADGTTAKAGSVAKDAQDA